MKRQGGRILSKTQKKMKLSTGPDIPGVSLAQKKQLDIPSSNLKRQYGQTYFQQKSIHPYSQNSQQQNKLIQQDPTKILMQMKLPEKYKEALGPNVEELKKFAKKKFKQNKVLEKLVKKGVIQPAQKLKPLNEKMEKDQAPEKIQLDETGRVLDDKGNVINLKQKNVQVLQVNIKKSKEQRIKEMMKNQRVGLQGQRDQRYFDQNVFIASTKRDRQRISALNFIEKGSIVKKAEAMRQNGAEAQTLHQIDLHNKSDQLNKQSDSVENQQQEQSQSQHLNQASVIPYGLKRVSVKIKHHDPVPDVEWWDLPLLPAKRQSYFISENQDFEKDSKAISDFENAEQHEKNILVLSSQKLDSSYFNQDAINNVIEQPALFKHNQNQNMVIPIYLTKDERKKINRKKRREKEIEKQDKIRLGIIKPPPPKVKLANMMRVLGSEAVQDPSKIEKEIKKSVAQRLKAHIERNAARKLNKEQKAEKMIRKLKKDSALECKIALFRIEDLSNRQLRFKVDKNASQLALHGVCLTPDKKSGLNLPSIVCVEGGPKALKFYKKLLLKRIKWNQVTQDPSEKSDSQQEEKISKSNNRCTLIWEGIIKDHNFKKWNIYEIKSEIEGKRLLAERNVEYYWDMALNPAVLQNE